MADNTICLTRDMENTLLDAATATGAGNAFAVPALPQGGRIGSFSWQTVVAGTFSALTVDLEGSDDGSNWGKVDESTATGGEPRPISGNPFNFLRANVTAFTGGTSVTVKLQLGSQ